MSDQRTRLDAARVTVEYDTVRGMHAVMVLPFPNPGDDDGVMIYGSLADLRGVVDTMAALLDDLESEDV